MPLHYVTGSAGSGKTAAARELEARDYLTYDTDDQADTGMFTWFTRYTNIRLPGYNRLSMPKNIFEDHKWKPTDYALGKLSIEGTTDLVYVCGKLEDPEPIIELTRSSGGLVVFLSVTDDTIRSRLEARASDPDAPVWGREEWQRDLSVGANRALEDRFRAMGAVMLDGEQPVDNVVNGIVYETTRPRP